jgi:hypothetical protein
MEVTAELTTGTTLSGTVMIIRIGCVAITIFIVGIVAAAIVMISI